MVVNIMVKPQLPNKDYTMHQWLWDYLHVFLWATYDNLMNIKNKLIRDDDVSRTIKIMTPHERRFIFSQDVRAGGYSTASLIKLFSDPELVVDEDSLTDMMNHETLHQVLKKICGKRACHALDNITKAVSMFNCDEKKWYFEVKFINKKIGKIFE